MKRILLLSVLLSCSHLIKADTVKTKFVIWAKDGSKVAYALVEKPKVTFTETDMIVTANGIVVTYALENMARFTYEKATPTDMFNLETSEFPFKLEDESLLFPNLHENSTVTVHLLNGTLVFTKNVPKTGEYVFPLSNLNAGVYLVSVNGITYKIVKR